MSNDPTTQEGVHIDARSLRASLRQRTTGVVLASDVFLYAVTEGHWHTGTIVVAFGAATVLLGDVALSVSRRVRNNWREAREDYRRARAMLRNGAVILPQTDPND
ncbi:hypothetical protein [Nocardia alba]|uniref:Uncharacterized protein n=1 Tax=Nocardia alba TaxID=225051 RepID=A0A4R1FGN5_9NOCA|nr:hypothetical protein [Nocardia alba]TCJ90011.1 hypothetical protein DFR71_6304 [Nocardia alba]